MSRQRYTRLPTATELAAIPLADAGEFELPDKEVARLRRHIYAVNRDGIRRFRTLRDDRLILVWRIK